ncbi:MAG: hypothetical protein GXO75_08600, partial [Calditrichaeota bacterium]|nr:hypothetical protein [Calditrichota bacterium]
MTKEEHIKYWLQSAEHDLATAESMFRSGKGLLKMVQIPTEIKEKIETYLIALKNNNIPLKDAVLFGSYA